MDAFVIEGGASLTGQIAVNGAKNAALPLLAASLLTDQPVTLAGAPRLQDTANMLRLLGELGVTTAGELDPGAIPGHSHSPAAISLHSTDPAATHARYDIVRTMRASICVLGPMLAARGRARVSMWSSRPALEREGNVGRKRKASSFFRTMETRSPFEISGRSKNRRCRTHLIWSWSVEARPVFSGRLPSRSCVGRVESLSLRSLLRFSGK
ncbi:MAG: hypothetical protein AAGB14_14765 [Verrucomicrobiota bacterium]